MQLLMPDNVRLIINKLQERGFEAYAVGGCVRDSYLGEIPHDWDITTNALPAQVKEIFRRTIDVGIQHGTVKIMLGNEGYEVTTYRIDGEYEDSRHPKQVTFTGELSEDLGRRDFTINAMAYSESTGIIDLYNGIGDIRAGIIRAVGDPYERFTEDALRMLRAIRFSARFGYEIEENTANAIKKLAPTLSKISAERIREELEKLIMTDHPDRLAVAYELGVTKVVLPEWDAMLECAQNSLYHIYDVGMHTLKVIEYIRDNCQDASEEDKRILRLSALLHDVGKPAMKTTDEKGLDHFKGHPEKGEEISRAVLRRLKYDNDTIHKVCVLVRYHDDRPSLTYPSVRKLMVAVNPDNMRRLIMLKYADTDAHSEYRKEENLKSVRTLDSMVEKIFANKDCLSIKDLAVSGKDLMDAGLKPGPELGDVLKNMLNYCLDNPDKNNKEDLMKLINR